MLGSLYSAQCVRYVNKLLIGGAPQGEYQEKRAVPFIPGNEIAGTVLRVGDGVTRFKDGDKVRVFVWNTLLLSVPMATPDIG